MIHKTAIIDPKANIGSDVTIGPTQLLALMLKLEIIQ